MKTVIRVDGLWKQYRLGVIGHGTLAQDLQSWWARVRGREDPNSKIAPLPREQQSQVEGNRFWALRDVNLEAREGEIVGIIGKNGAGKSTLLKILSRVTKPTRGEAMFRGRLASLLEIGTGFHPELTGMENIFLNGAILGMSKREVRDKIDAIVSFSGVEQYIDTPVKRYSSGMRVRLGFAVAAHLDPEILLVDEVLAVGDAEFQKKALGKMKEVTRSQRRTVVFVSHNMASIGNLCSRVCVMNNGTIEYDGDTAGGIRYYLGKAVETDESLPVNAYEDDPLKAFSFLESWVEDGRGEKLTLIQSGQQVAFVVSYRASPELSGSVYVSMNVYSEDNVVLMTLSNRFVSRAKLPITPRGKAVFTIRKFPLPAGKYTYRLKAAGFGVGSLDMIDHAGTLTVIRGDFYGTGKMVKGYASGVLVEHAFTAEAVDTAVDPETTPRGMTRA